MADQAVKFTPRDLNQAWHELQRSGGRVTFDAVRARAQQIREQAIAAEQTGALFMQDGGLVRRVQPYPLNPTIEELAPEVESYLSGRQPRAAVSEEPRLSPEENRARIARELESRLIMERERSRIAREQAAAVPSSTPRPAAANSAPAERPAAVSLEEVALPESARPLAVPEPTTREAPAVEPQERRGRRFKPWERIKQAWGNYITKTGFGAEVIGQRLRNDYQALINQALEAQLIDQAEAKQREKILESVGEQLLNEPVQMRLALGEGGAVKKDWEAYRKSIRQAVKDRGGDAKAVLEADRMVTEYQMKKFEEYGTQAYAALAAGDAQTARRLMSQAFQYVPTGTQMRFETRTSPQGQQLVAIFTDEESGEPVDAKVMSPESLLGYIERLKNPAAWLSIVSDLTAKERGQVLSAMDTEIRAAQAAAQQLSAEASMLSAQTSAARAARELEEGRGIMTPKDFSEMIQEENKLRSESLDENALPPIPIEDALKMRGLVERIHAYQPALSVGDIGHLVVKGWGDPQLIEKLVAADLLPPGSDSAFADGGYVSRFKERASQMVRSGRQAVEESQKQGTGLAHRAGRELHNRGRKIDEVVDQAVR